MDMLTRDYPDIGAKYERLAKELLEQVNRLDEGLQWEYIHTDDPMGKGLIHQATVVSTNTVDFDFPYSGPQYGTLTLRTHPRYGRDVVFRIEKGQFICRLYEGCNVVVRFDDDSPTTFSAIGSADHSSKVLFIQNYDKFLGKMLKAKRLRISVNVFQEAAPMFEFDVKGFDQIKYKNSS
ncbi:hypothetical protein DIC66_10360 [Rhodoferax lacus]|uniref:Uncharacterized protein n=2 Tax=Rhodoferax lacus TaxID=2184758 RepID=A0A3E1RC01_9BURK|nr:hypothetical protein DIC66_10360 [Rhodoferax lacus]